MVLQKFFFKARFLAYQNQRKKQQQQQQQKQ